MYQQNRKCSVQFDAIFIEYMCPRAPFFFFLQASATLTTSFLLRQVWIPAAQSMVKKFIRSCVPCFRFRPRHGGQLMGQLPPARPFSRTGFDYAGPIMCRTTAGRGHKSYKAYIALFVCMAPLLPFF
jgi:hypothetical protein